MSKEEILRVILDIAFGHDSVMSLEPLVAGNIVKQSQTPAMRISQLPLTTRSKYLQENNELGIIPDR